jgi:hypothetical protein
MISCFGSTFQTLFYSLITKLIPHKGRTEFNKPFSKILLWLTLLISVIQMAFTVYLMSVS